MTPLLLAAPDVVGALTAAGIVRGRSLAVAVAPGVGVGLATDDRCWAIGAVDVVAVVAAIEDALHPRWLWWSTDTAAALVVGGLRVGICWDVAAVHRLLFGGWRAEIAHVWAVLQDRPTDALPGMGQMDLLGGGGDEGTDFEDPVRPDGHLRPEWVAGGWADAPSRLALWAATAFAAATRQRERLAALEVGGNAEATARSESAAELLCAELAADGLPIDVATATTIIADAVGPRPGDEAEATAQRVARDDAVRERVPGGGSVDLRNPLDVRAMLRRVGIDVPDTRAWRLEAMREAHPVVDALLTWRKAERIATTYGWSWLDEHVGADGRLRGAWTGTDGAAGRMTAQAGLHNLPAEMRPAVAAEPGHVLVRADLGQIEPRVLAAVSGDAMLTRATASDDLYAPVAARLDVERSVAKVAVLAAMYGQTSGVAGKALQGLERAYPAAIRYLQQAEAAGRAGHDVRTHGGRLVRMFDTPDDVDEQRARAIVAGRGRYARNAVVQGAAAELFKVWAVTVRARAAALDARIVLCLHDELLVHARRDAGAAVAQLLHDCLGEAAHRWTNGGAVRFVADVSVIDRWSEAK